MDMRVTQNSLYNNTANDILQNYSRYVNQQSLVASGKSILKPSDNPANEAQAIQTRELITNNQQFTSNINEARSWVDYSSTQLNSVVTALQDARQQVVEISNDVTAAPGSPQRQAAAQSIDAILEEMLNYGNAQFEGRYLFNGYQTQTPPFTATRNAAGEITAVAYSGNPVANESIARGVAPGQQVDVNVDGKAIFTDPSGTSSNEKIFNELISLRNDLQSNKPIATANGSTPPYTYPNLGFLTQHLTALQNTINTVDNVQARLGETSASLGRMAQQNAAQLTNLQGLLSSYEDLDMAKGALQLTNQLNLYQAAINAGSKIVTPSLMQFLR